MLTNPYSLYNSETKLVNCSLIVLAHCITFKQSSIGLIILKFANTSSPLYLSTIPLNSLFSIISVARLANDLKSSKICLSSLEAFLCAITNWVELEISTKRKSFSTFFPTFKSFHSSSLLNKSRFHCGVNLPIFAQIFSNLISCKIRLN